MKEETREYRFKDELEYRNFLDQAPDNSWLQNRSIGKGQNHVFIPIFITEANADFIFRQWHVIEEKYAQISNGIMATVKIKAEPDYPGADEIFITGSGATQYKEKAGNHVEFDVPNVRERAIGKAFATLGNVFGRSLNRSYIVNKGGVDVKQIIKPDFSFIKPKPKKDEATKPE